MDGNSRTSAADYSKAIQQQMQSEINESEPEYEDESRSPATSWDSAPFGSSRIRESLSSVFMEITAAVRNNAAADQEFWCYIFSPAMHIADVALRFLKDLKMKIQMLNEQAQQPPVTLLVWRFHITRKEAVRNETAFAQLADVIAPGHGKTLAVPTL